MTDFHIGQLVVCVDDKPREPKMAHLIAWPVKGLVYTIRGFKETADGLGLYIEEIVNREQKLRDGTFGEPGYYLDRFRPVRKTSIEAFTAMLNTTKEDA